MYHLGLNFSHNPSAVLVFQHKIICAFEESKLIQEKGFNGFPFESILLCKENIPIDQKIQVSIGFESISDVLISHRNLLKISRIFSIKILFLLFFDLVKLVFPNYFNTDRTLVAHLKVILEKIFNRKIIINLYNHHLSHAASAAFAINWQHCVVFTLDGWGDGLSGSLYLKTNQHLKLIDSFPLTDSIGSLYSQTTRALGFKANRHEGKVTGLAAFGKPTYILDELNKFSSNLNFSPTDFNLDRLSDKKVYEILLNQRPGFKGKIWTRTENKLARRLQLFHNLNTNLIEDYFKNGVSREDISAGVQAYCEQKILSYLKKIYLKFPNLPQKIVLAGGVFANVKINQKILEELEFEDIFIQPAMDDSGTALGSAFLDELKSVSDFKPKKINDYSSLVYLGNEYKSDYLAKLASELNIKKIGSLLDAEMLARLVYQGKIVGIFSGRSEFGPRALGNRSILAGAHIPGMSMKLNTRLKRSDFMPFAPLVIDSDYSDFMDNLQFKSRNKKGFPIAAYYMTITGNVRTAFHDKFPEVVHIDGTARPQIIEKSFNSLIWNVLSEFKKIYGYGVMINTSFNLHETPIVSNPKTAINMLQNGSIDYLLLGDQIYTI